MRRAVAVLGLLCVVRCGGRSITEGADGDGNEAIATCGDLLACGGDVVGSWDIEEVCVDEEATGPIADCPNSTARYSRYDVSGALAFDASGVVTQTIDSRLAYTWNIPRSCVFDLTCSDIEDLLNSTSTGAGNTVSIDAACPEAASVCRCDVRATIAGTTTATYYVSGSTLSIDSGDSLTFYDYCAASSELSLRTQGGGYRLTRN